MISRAPSARVEELDFRCRAGAANSVIGILGIDQKDLISNRD